MCVYPYIHMCMCMNLLQTSPGTAEQQILNQNLLQTSPRTTKQHTLNRSLLQALPGTTEQRISGMLQKQPYASKLCHMAGHGAWQIPFRICQPQILALDMNTAAQQIVSQSGRRLLLRLAVLGDVCRRFWFTICCSAAPGKDCRRFLFTYMHT